MRDSQAAVAVAIISTEVLNPRRGVPQWGYDADTQTLTTFAHTYERCIIYLSVNTTTIGTAPTSCSMFAQMFAQMFQRLSCGFYALDPSLACSKFAQMFQRLLHSFFALYCASLLGIYCQAALYV